MLPLFERPPKRDNASSLADDIRAGSTAGDASALADRTLLVHVSGTTQRNDEVSEFRELATSAGLEIVGSIASKRLKPDPRYFVGSGKLEEIETLARASEASLVLFSEQLSASQERNLEKVLQIRVLDRTSLILDIFAQRARTFEGKLQVELAQLSHLSTRLVRGWTHLERQKGGIGLRGPGETQLETDRRLLAIRVKTLRSRLDKVRKQRQQGRQSRGKSGIPSVALVGYTNAGKSTLFNRLTQETVYAADQLFATLDPTLRRLDLPGGRSIVLADTVGFISRLPHELVDAFQSTLTETRDATLLLHVVDAADEEKNQRIADVNTVLAEIGAIETPQLIVYNKLDSLNKRPHVDRDENGNPVAVGLSALNGEGLPELIQAIQELVVHDRVSGWLTLPPALVAKAGQVRARLFEADAMRDEQMDDDGALRWFIETDQLLWEQWCREFGMDHDALVTEPDGSSLDSAAHDP